jgi:hypothetical protein
MVNAENTFVPRKTIEKCPKRWLPNGRCGLNPYRPI